MQRLIDDLLAFTTVVGTGQVFEAVDLNLLVKEVISEFQDAIDQEDVTLINVGSLPTVRGISFQLRQLFVNLVSNSIKFRAKDRPLSISITASSVRIPEMANVYGAVRFERIEVRDNGIGFPPEQAEKIFDMFERLHSRDQFSGTGIGLAICRRIMENNRGFIRAEGTSHQGAVFQVFLRAE